MGLFGELRRECAKEMSYSCTKYEGNTLILCYNIGLVWSKIYTSNQCRFEDVTFIHSTIIILHHMHYVIPVLSPCLLCDIAMKISLKITGVRSTSSTEKYVRYKLRNGGNTSIIIMRYLCLACRGWRCSQYRSKSSQLGLGRSCVWKSRELKKQLFGGKACDKIKCVGLDSS